MAPGLFARLRQGCRGRRQMQSQARLEFWPFFGPFRVQKIIFSFRKIFSQYSVPYRNRSPWNSKHSTSSTVPHRITHRQTHDITTKAYSFNDVKYTVFSIYLIRNHEHIANITYSPSIIYSLGPETKLGIPTLAHRVWSQGRSQIQKPVGSFSTDNTTRKGDGRSMLERHLAML